MDEIIEYYGYNFSNSKEYLVSGDNGFELFVEADHIYKRYNSIELYDKGGQLVKVEKIKVGQEVKRESKKKEFIQESVFQLDYKMYVAPIGRCSNQGEVERIYYTLSNTYGKIFEIEHHDSRNMHTLFYEKDPYHKRKAYAKQLVDYVGKKPIEVNCTGFSLMVSKKAYKSAVNLNIQEYIRESEEFIKGLENKGEESLSDQAYTLLRTNLEYLSAFYMITPKQLRSIRTDKLKCSINRINYNINSKSKNYATSKQ
jgi:hypothetical protein